MFSLTVTRQEIEYVRVVIQTAIYPQSLTLTYITRFVYGDVNQIKMRKIRLCITELRKRGYLIIAKRGYSMAGDDPEPVIHFINGMYSRAHSLTTDADIMFHGLKQKYGDAVSAKVEQLPKQPAFILEPLSKTVMDIINRPIPLYKTDADNNSHPFRKSIDARGNEIALQFEADA